MFETKRFNKDDIGTGPGQKKTSGHNFPTTKACPSQTKATYYNTSGFELYGASLVWQVSKRHKVSEMVKLMRWAPLRKGQALGSAGLKPRKMVENYDNDPGSYAKFPPVSTHFPGSSAHFVSNEVQ